MTGDSIVTAFCICSCISSVLRYPLIFTRQGGSSPSLGKAERVIVTMDSASVMIYGTAWKREETANLVRDALETGFRAVDVAAQPEHYQEDLVGQGIRQFLEKGPTDRKDLYVRLHWCCSFWPADLDGDHQPYDLDSAISTQVRESITGSLFNLFDRLPEEWNPDCYLDCVLLHCPLETWGKTVEAWKALEAFVPHRVCSLGISNVTLQVLSVLCTSKSIKVRPTVVQNRFCEKNAFDKEVRRLCEGKGIVYQAFWVLTANPELLKSEAVRKLAQEAKIGLEVASLGGKISVLNGTTKHITMCYDLASFEHLKCWIRPETNAIIWEDCLGKFKERIGDTP